jgi:hypothetical protein
MSEYDRQTLITSTELAAVAVFAYTGADDMPRLMPVTPLLLDGAPTFTITYACLELAREIAASPQAALVFHDSRLAYAGWNPLTVRAGVKVVPDPDGDLFYEELLDQELRKFPPDRQLIDSPLLRRENWWYMPRLIVRLVETGEPRPIARRETSDHGVLAYVSGEGLTADAVRVEDWDADRIPVRLLGDEPSRKSSPAALLYHDFAVPDMDPRATFLATGLLENGRLFVTRRSGSRLLGKRPGLLTRWRGQKDLERRCKAGLKEREGL